METEEDRAMKLKISQLAGKINRHKNQQAASDATPNYHYNPYNRHGNYRGNSFGYRGGRPSIHRNRSLVLNGVVRPQTGGEVDSGTASDASNASWVSKTYPNHQLINNAVYERGTNARAHIIEESQRKYQARKDFEERRRLFTHLQLIENSGGLKVANKNQYEIVVDGIRFFVTRNGSKLVRTPGENNTLKATPKEALVGGVKFYRSKTGNLYRHQIVKAQRHAAPFKKTPCRVFTSTGSCPHGPRCRYIHDPAKVAACKDLLLRGTCSDGDACDLSHDLTPERTPHCLHFAKDNCTKSDCKYAHVKVSSGARVCQSFGFYGYCEKGAQCTDRHVYECPNFSNTGVCRIKNCKLPHRERASILRKASNPVVMDDLSSDEDDQSVNSNDVDSDEVDEFIGQDEAMDSDIADQRDYIEL